MDLLIEEILALIKRADRRILIGISGHGAAGKTTFTQNLAERIGKDHLNILNTDPYITDSAVRKNTMITYEWEGKEHTFKMTACHPAAHHMLSLERDMKMLKKGMDLYTLDTDWLPSELLSSDKKVTVAEGMSVAFLDQSLFDLSIYFYTDGETEFLRRSGRDIKERGMELEYLKQSHHERRVQYEVFMHRYREGFDVVVNTSGDGFVIEKMRM
ncbi:uridine kinase family protein [Jeotgalibacillus salarius]|uniref:Phosphoribulokinase n=1 Tax=Jeotgalibacillus salarius TaxID=546023 RepID=A0A4Y8LIS0_9BACL|nr:phosphoribulokinase [Jeotgalibacillus salarius]TFE02368.1 phosphoribulokinase [Jeotgalibacillus salarius]